MIFKPLTSNSFKIFFFSLVASILLNSCGAIVKSAALKKYTIENNEIPPDFGKEKNTLICVLKGRGSRDNYMKKHVKKRYKGDYEFVLESDLDNPKYSDMDNYRYLFDYNAGSVSAMGRNAATGTMQPVNLPTSSYYIKDRKQNVYFSNNFSSGFFSKLIEAYVINLEKARSAN